MTIGKTGVLALAAVIVIGAAPVCAQEEMMTSLSPVKVRALVNKMTEKTRPGGRLSDEDVRLYLGSHLAEDAQFTSHMTYRIPGFEDQVQDFVVDKAQFIDNILTARGTMKNYKSTVKVTEIDIARDKQYALVRIDTKESGEMPVGEGQYMPFTGEASCQQEIRIAGSVPQITGAACTSLVAIVDKR